MNTKPRSGSLLVVAGSLVTLGSVSTAWADLVVTGVGRNVACYGEIREDDNIRATHQELFNDNNPGLWSGFAGMSVRYDVGTVDGFASHTSDVGTQMVTFSASSDAAAAGYERQDVDPDGYPITIFGQSYGGSRSDFFVTFTLYSTQTWRLNAGGFSQGGGASAEVTLIDSNGNVYFSAYDYVEDQTLTLPAGSYTLSAYTSSGAVAYGSDFASSRSAVAGTFEFLIPAPGTIALLGAGCFGLRRRR